MNLTISGHHLEVTPALRSYVTGKLDRIIRHFDQVVDVKVLLTVEKQKEKEKTPASGMQYSCQRQ
jgi:putative sigma-54 modulation protein